MSILIKVLRIRLQKNPINKVVLAIYSTNQQITSQPSLPSTQPHIDLTFLISKEIKVVSFAIQQQIADGKYFIVGKLDLYLYNIEELRQGQKAIKMFDLKKIAQTNVVSDLAIFAGSIVFQISRSTRRKIISEIEKIELIRQTQQQQVERAERQILPTFQQISIIKNQRMEIQMKQENISFPNQIKHTNQIYQVDQSGYVILKPLKAQLELQQILNQLPETEIKPAEQQKLKLSFEQKQQFIEIDPKKLRQSAVVKHIRMKQQKINKKPQIFEHITQRQTDHIGVNPSSNMFEVYTMCCGEQIDKSHQIEYTY